MLKLEYIIARQSNGLIQVSTNGTGEGDEAELAVAEQIALHVNAAVTKMSATPEQCSLRIYREQ